ncbi:MAG: hypothetical protein NTX98_00840 [Candidatus Doudnabacteria bacterium]|nr:hypothetical protein [Candidatus Doudnabacteria bacterium]
MNNGEKNGIPDKPRHDYLDATEKHQIESGERCLKILLEKGKGWDFIARDVIKNQIPALMKIADKLTDQAKEDEVRDLIRRLDEAIPDSFEYSDSFPK